MWSKVLGHERQKEFLARYLTAQERLHALLFTGAEGLGKKQLALEFAKSLLCPAHTGEDGCESCRLMNLEDGNLSHPDFLWLRREADAKTGRLKDISIEQIKDLIGKAAFAPVMSPVKVCLLEDVDRMSIAAANSFLKLLEEPPAGWVLLLIAADGEKLLPTILSRVVQLRFQPVPEELVRQALAARNITGEQPQVLARISEGSVGLAVSLQEQDVFGWRQQALALLEALPLKMPLTYLSGRVWQQKECERGQALLFTRLLYLLLRDMLVCKLQAGQKIYNCDMERQLLELSGGWQPQGLKKALRAVQEAYDALESSVGTRLTLEAMALKIDKIYQSKE